MRVAEPFTMTKKQIVYMMDVDERTVTTWETRTEDPMPIALKGKSRGHPNEYDPVAIMQWSIRQAVRKLRPAEEGREILDQSEEKARLNKEQADAAAIKNAVTRRELAPVDMLEEAAAKMAGQVSAILDSLPVKLRNRMPSMTATTMDLVKTEIARAKNACAAIQIKL